jgi:glycosyltransferase involved in cell wall biosynthesis
MITKNEENNIERCINSYKHAVSEVIVVDTGSTDNTVTKAKALGAKVFSHAWENNFAKAKNMALSNAKGDWIIFLDADEYFDSDTSSKLEQIIKGYHLQENVQSILCRLINIDINDGNKKLGEQRNVRIFRNIEGVAYEGEIHEDLRYKGKPLTYIFDQDILIYHTGYEPRRYESKLRRNLEILLSNKKDNKTNTFKNNLYLANTYLGLGEYLKTVEYINKVNFGEENVIGNKTLPFEILFEAMIGLNDFSDSYMDKLVLAEGMYPNQPIFAYYQAIAYFKQAKYNDSLNYFAKALQLNLEYNDLSEKNPMKDNVDRAYYYMAVISELKNDVIKGLEYFVLSLRANKYNAESFARFCILVKNDKPEEIAAILNDIYDKNRENDVKFLVEELSKYKIGPVLYYYWKIWYEQYKHQDIFYPITLVANNKYEEAYKYFINDYRNPISQLYITTCSLFTANLEYIEEALKKVSLPYQIIIKAFAEVDDTVLSDDQFSEYSQVLDVIMALTNQETVRLFLNTKNNFSSESMVKISEMLYYWKFKEAAFEGYERVILDITDQGIKSQILVKMGLCNYHLGRLEKAASNFKSALELGYLDSKLIDFLSWIKEKFPQKNY